MPRPLRSPNRVETINFPVFGMTWFGNPGDGTSIVAYCGGGGSAKTGVNNLIVVQEGGDETHRISTGDKVGIALNVFQNPLTGKIWLVVALGSEVRRYGLPAAQLAGTIQLDGEASNTLAVSAMGDFIAVGCESGLIQVYAISDDQFGAAPGEKTLPLFSCQGHTKTVCALAFSARGGRLLSSAKDGTACLWIKDKMIAGLRCTIEEPEAPTKGRKPARPPQILVRGCAFGDLEGKIIYTVASARRGKAFLARWHQAEKGFRCVERTECSANPVSAMSLSQDFGLMTLGSVDGTVTLWSCEDWEPLKVFKEVHDLPVTCIAARPFPLPLQGEDDGVQIHARTASADSRLACVTLQRRAPKQASSSKPGLGLMGYMHRLISLTIMSLILSPVILEARRKCEGTLNSEGLDSFRECLVHEVIIAPAWKPGITVPPH